MTQVRAQRGWKAFTAELREMAWVYLLIPLFLAGFMSAGSNDPLNPARAGQYLAMHSIIILMIGPSVTAAYCFVFGYAVRRPDGVVDWIARLLSIAVGMVAGTDIAVRILGMLGLAPDTWATRANILRIGTVVSLTVIAAAIVITRLHDQRREFERRADAAQREKLRAQLEALQARTHPHFLFNALNTVASLIEDEPRRAETAIEKLSVLFRYALDGSEQLQVPLAKELQVVRDYLDVERMRFEDRLRVKFDIDVNTLELVVPPFVLQPLVENAVGHGITACREGGTIEISAQLTAGQLVLQVDDDGPGERDAPTTGSGTAQSNLRERLRLAYGDSARLDAGAGANGGYRACVRLPALTEGTGLHA